MRIIQSHRHESYRPAAGSTLSIVSMGMFDNVPSHYMHRPRTEDYLMMLVTRGKGHVHSESQQRHVAAGDLVLLDQGPEQAYGSDVHDPWAILWVHFKGPAAEDYFRRMRQSPPFGGRIVGQMGLDARIQRRFEEMITSSRWAGHDEALLETCLLHGLLGLIICRLNQPVSPQPTQGRQEDLAQVLGYIDDHLQQPLTAGQLAKAGSMSTRQLTRLFTRQFDRSPMAYVQHRKAQQAAMLLSQTDMPIKQIAQAVGCDDPYYFSRMFSKTMGQSPTAYRQANRPGG